MIYWLFLAASIALEVVGVLLLNHASQTNATSTMMVMYALVIASYFLLSKAVKRIPLGFAYALWEGAGIVLITASSVVLFGEHISAMKIVGLSLLLVAITLLKSGTQTAAPALHIKEA